MKPQAFATYVRDVLNDPDLSADQKLLNLSLATESTLMEIAQERSTKDDALAISTSLLRIASFRLTNR